MVPWHVLELMGCDAQYYSTADMETPPPGKIIKDENCARIALAQKLLGMLDEKSCVLPAQFLPERRYEDALRWTEVPLLALEETAACVYPALLGLLPFSEIRIEDGWLMPDSREAAHSALACEAKKDHGFILLRGRSAPPRGIGGPSLGLPLAVAAKLLAAGLSFPKGLFITGTLKNDGEAMPVGGAQAKHDAAQSRCRDMIFLYPRANQPLADENAIQVDSLKTAYIISLLLCKHVNGLPLARMLRNWRESPEEFFSSLASGALPEGALPPLLDLAERENWKKNFPAAVSMARSVENLCKWRKANPFAANFLLERLLDFFDLDEAEQMDDLAFIRLAGMRVTQNNHKGIIDDPWRVASRDRCHPQKLAPLSGSAAEALGVALIAEIRNTINFNHNHYDFQADIPAEWLDAAKRLEQSAAGLPDEKLGKFYGALTHWAAFRGNLDEALDYAERSLVFFLSFADKSRRWLDMVYIYCDRGDVNAAWKYLLKAFAQDIASMNGVLAAQSDNEYFHAAYARLCTIEENRIKNYPVDKIFDPSRRRHPWQCWANNCGRLLLKFNARLAEKLLFWAAEVCLDDPAALTLTPMALSPLAALWRSGASDKEKTRILASLALARMREACAVGKLCSRHFEEILNTDWREALEIVEEKRATLFPFNYS